MQERLPVFCQTHLLCNRPLWVMLLTTCPGNTELQGTEAHRTAQ